MFRAALHPREAPLISLLLLKDEEEGPERSGLDSDLLQLAHNHSTDHHNPITLGTILSDQYYLHLSHSF